MALPSLFAAPASDARSPVDVTGDASEHEWDRYVEGHTEATLYHLTAWRRIFERAFGAVVEVHRLHVDLHGARRRVGRTLLWNLISHPFGGVVFPVNPKRAAVLGIKSYPSLSAIPDRVDLAVVVTPAPSVPGIMSESPAPIRTLRSANSRSIQPLSM